MSKPQTLRKNRTLSDKVRSFFRVFFNIKTFEKMTALRHLNYV